LFTNYNDDSSSSDNSASKISLAMDWTPNTNHTGIYVAKAKGWYKEQDIDLEILPYSTGASADTLVGTGKADIGISFTESIVTSSVTDAPVTSVAAIIPTNTSSVAVREDSGIESPKDLDGKIYGGYGAPYDESVMKQIIKNSGGKGNFKTVVVDTDLIDVLESKRVDFVWIFDGWQKIQAERKGFKIKTFPTIENGIPDYYTPNIVSSPKTIDAKTDELKRFMLATRKGYEFAASNPKEAAAILVEQAGSDALPDEEQVKESQIYLAGVYNKSKTKWGLQSESMWQEYPEFMVKNKAVLDLEGRPVSKINSGLLYTNKLLK
ncbi:ABC transporter substrate-binding protein, partial [Candidatus Saccharibacteria bacterium]|nr:ABC transporter substrate-binding protein [Candidatus Saccharibacteria bacterium]